MVFTPTPNIFHPKYLSQGSLGTLQIEIGGTTPGEYDQLNITGDAVLAGTLEVQLINGFTPTVGDVFTFLTVGGLQTGSFDNYVPIEFTGGYLDLVAGNQLVATAGSLSSVPLPPAIWLFLTALAGLGFNRRQKINT